MNLEIQVRCVNLLFLEKELQVLLVPGENSNYTFPADVGLEPVQGNASVLEKPGAFLPNERTFVGPINRIPNWKIASGKKQLAFDFYVLRKPDSLINHHQGGKWISIEEGLQLGKNISSVLSHTLQRLREDLNFQLIEYHLLPVHFTIPELRCLYEIIFNKKLDRANFFRKITVLDILETVGKKRKGTCSKAPLLYSFNHKYFKKTEEGLVKLF